MFQPSNLIRSDSYKWSQWNQLPPDTTGTYSYQESRGGMFDRVQMQGLQYYTENYLKGRFFTPDEVDETDRLAEQHFGRNDVFNRNGWMQLFAKHGGKLPLHIRAIPEGHMVDVHNALFTVESTDPEFAWLTNWIETLLMKVWYPVTVGTLSWHLRQSIGKALAKTGTVESILYKLYDFGYRGVSSEESAAIGGMAHLMNFNSSETPIAIPYMGRFYGEPNPAPGSAIPAMEHTTVIAWGEKFEAEAFKNMLRQYPVGMVAGVSDTYDIKNAVENIWGRELRDEVISRKGTLVVRPDSGDPLEIVLMVLNILGDRFGYDNNQKGYKILPPSVRVIQGDGINYHSINQIIRGVTESGWSLDNLVFGMGGALLQQVNRDTQRFAYKLSAIKRGDVWHDVRKNPKSDPSKASKGGRFAVKNTSGRFITIPAHRTGNYGLEIPEPGDMLESVFLNGDVLTKYTRDEIRKRAFSYDTF